MKTKTFIEWLKILKTITIAEQIGGKDCGKPFRNLLNSL